MASIASSKLVISSWVARILSTIPPKWIPIVAGDGMRDRLIEILNKVRSSAVGNGKITPDPFNIFRYLIELPDPNQVRVVIIGQDPYPKAGEAHGLCFSSTRNVMPASMRKIIGCLKKYNNNFKQSGYNLTCWAKQGVLLLNAGLTTLVSKVSSHLKLWLEYTKDIVFNLSVYLQQRKLSAVFLLMGSFAKGFRRQIVIPDLKDKTAISHVIVTATHPSPVNTRYNFMADDHFGIVNTHLIEKKRKPINWNIVPCKASKIVFYGEEKTKTEKKTKEVKKQTVTRKEEAFIDRNNIKIDTIGVIIAFTRYQINNLYSQIYYVRTDNCGIFVLGVHDVKLYLARLKSSIVAKALAIKINKFLNEISSKSGNRILVVSNKDWHQSAFVDELNRIKKYKKQIEIDYLNINCDNCRLWNNTPRDSIFNKLYNYSRISRLSLNYINNRMKPGKGISVELDELTINTLSKHTKRE